MTGQWLCGDYSHLLVAQVEAYETVYLCHLDSYTVTVCTRYLVSSHVVTVQLPTRYLQSCTKLIGTHALLIIITFIIKMYVYKMTCMIQYPCSKHASSPSLPHQAMLVYICFLFIHSALSFTTLILGSGEQSFYYKVSQQFCTRLYPTAEKIKYQNQKMSHKIQTRCRNCVIFAGNNV